MATATITPPVGTQQGNFHFNVTINPASGNAELVRSSFDKTKLQVSDSKNIVGSDNFTLLEGEGVVFQIHVWLPDEKEGELTIGLGTDPTTDSVNNKILIRDSGGTEELETIEAVFVKITYNTKGSVLLTFGSHVYHEDGRITMPITAETNIHSFVVSDFIFEEVEGDDISNMRAELAGEETQYELTIIPEIDKQGKIIIDVQGKVFTDDGTIHEEVVHEHAIIDYNRLIPIAETEAPLPLAPGKWPLYVDYNVLVQLITDNVGGNIETSGLELDLRRDITIYRAVGNTKPTSEEYNDLTGDAWTVSTGKSKWFVLVFDIPEIIDDTLNIALKDVRNVTYELPT